MRSKLTTLDEAIAAIPSGSRIAFGGNTFHRGPGAAVHELVRQGKTDLELVKTAGSYDIDLLCAAGVASSVSAGYVGYETVLGMAQAFRRTVQGGRVVSKEHACYTVIAGLRASIQGVPFMPVAGLVGSDLLSARDFRMVADPWTGEEVVAVPALRPDVALIHVHEADQLGNAVIEGSLFEDLLMIQAARTVILTAERIVDGSLFESVHGRANVSSLYVTAVVEAHHGAWPFGMFGLYEPDLGFMQRFTEVAADDAAASAFISREISVPVTA